jgi:hypothetical protein
MKIYLKTLCKLKLYTVFITGTALFLLPTCDWSCVNSRAHRLFNLRKMKGVLIDKNFAQNTVSYFLRINLYG